MRPPQRGPAPGWRPTSPRPAAQPAEESNRRQPERQRSPEKQDNKQSEQGDGHHSHAARRKPAAEYPGRTSRRQQCQHADQESGSIRSAAPHDLPIPLAGQGLPESRCQPAEESPPVSGLEQRR